MELIADKRLWKSFLRFSKFQLRSRDVDPTYPVLKKYYKLRGLNSEERLWFTFIFCAYYDVGSAEKFFNERPKPKHIGKSLAALPTGVERRGMRGENGGKLVKRHLNAVVEHRSLIPIEYASPKKGWTMVREWYEDALPFTGPWSSYKFADLMRNVHGVDITAPDFGVGGGGKIAGPVAGLVALTGRDLKECATNLDMHRELYKIAKEEVDYDGMEEMETCLCDFNSAMHGRYYIGHDIDQMQAQLIGAGASRTMYKARGLVINELYLGEKNGWEGPRKHLNKLYVEKKKFIWW